MNLPKLLILLFACSSVLLSCRSTSAKMMTYNIRYDNPNDGNDWWDLRKDEVAALIQKYNPDFLGLQEALPNQTAFIADNLNAYQYIGHGRDGIGTNSEGAPIFFKKKKYELLSFKTIWLSDTPDKISIGWDAALNRIVTYGVFKNNTTNNEIHVFNAHFDHRGELARQNSAALLVDYIKKNDLINSNVVLMGDFNSEPSELPIQTLNQEFQDSYLTKGISIDGPFGTFNAFDTTEIAVRRIDYIFTKNMSVQSYKCIDDRRDNGLHVSDHFGLIIEVK